MKNVNVIEKVLSIFNRKKEKNAFNNIKNDSTVGTLQIISPENELNKANELKNYLNDKNLQFTKEYQAIVTKKLSNEVENVYKISENFLQRIYRITNEIIKQKQLILDTKEVCLNTKPNFKEVESKIKEINEITEEAYKITKNGMKEIEKAVKQIDTINDWVMQIAGITTVLEEQSGKIESLINTITEIADNTTIMAINSSIVASKAGVLGTSFSVVASEIKSLSTQVVERINLIKNSISEVRINTQLMVDNTSNSLNDVQNTMDIVKNSEARINNIINSIKESEKVSTKIKTFTNELYSKNQKILQILGKIDSFSDIILNLSDSSLSYAKQQIDSIKMLDYHSTIVKQISNKAKELIKTEQTPNSVIKTFVNNIITIDAHLALYNTSRQFCEYIYITLVKYSQKGKIIPYLAQTWILDNERTWHFKLKENVKFHNGKKITAADVKFSFERALNPKLNSKTAYMLKIIDGTDEYLEGKTNEISGIKIKDKYSISFKLKQPYNYFLSLLTNIMTAIIPKDDSIFNSSIEHPISAGPFVFVEYNQKENCYLLEANKDFIDKQPYINKVIVYDRVNNPVGFLTKNKIDYFLIDPNFAKTFIEQQKDNYSIKSFQSRTVVGLSVNFYKNNYITKNKSVRHAISYAIDKERIVREVYDDYATVAHTILRPSILNNNNKVYFEYNPDKARKILKSLKDERSLDKPITLAIIKKDDKSDNQFAKAIKIIGENLTAVGMNIKLVEVPIKEKVTETLREYDLLYVGWIPDIDLYLSLEPFINPEGSDNLFGYNNPELYKKLLSSLVIKHRNQRQKYFLKLIDEITDDVFMVPIIFTPLLFAHQLNIDNIRINIHQDFILSELIITENHKINKINPPENILFHVQNNHKKMYKKTSFAIDSVSQTTDYLMNTIYKIVNLLKEQKSSVNNVYNKGTEFINLSAEVKNQTRITLDTIDSAINVSKEGREIILSIVNSLNTHKKNINSLNLIITKLKENMKNMSSVTTSVEDIVNDIKNVAMNASIIAAKSGKWRIDFSQVSQSIRELSTQIKGETNKINLLIEGMENTITDSVNKVVLGIEVIEKSILNIKKGDEALIKISNITEKTQNVSVVVSNKIENLLGSMDKILNSVNTLKKSSSNISNITGSLGFSSNLQSSIIEELKIFSEDIIKIFKLFENASINNSKLQYKSKNILKIAEEPLTLDPAKIDDLPSTIISGLSMMGLIKVYNVTQMIPYLAKSWTLEENNLTWTFYLNKGVKFHNGRIVTAMDVKYSLERLFSTIKERNTVFEKIEGAIDFVNGRAKEVSGIKIIDDYTISFNLIEPYSLFEQELAGPDTVIFPKEEFEKDSQCLISCGPFIYKGKSEEKGIYYFEKNKDYFKGEPFIDEIQVYYKIKEADKFSNFINKKIGYTPLTKKQMEKVSKMPEYKDCIIKQNSPFVFYVLINFDKKNPISNYKEMRQAIAYSIDRKRIIKEAYEGLATAPHCIVPLEEFEKSKNLQTYEYNPIKARELINEIKLTHNIDVNKEYKLSYYNSIDDPLLERLIKLLEENINDVGINLKIVKISRKEMLETETRLVSGDLFVIGFSDLVLNPYTSFESIIDPSIDHITNYTNPVLLKNLWKILKIKNPQERWKILTEVSDELSKELPWISIVRSIDYYAHQPYLMNFKIGELGEIDFPNIWIKPH